MNDVGVVDPRPEEELAVVAENLHVHYEVYEDRGAQSGPLISRLRSRASTSIHAVQGVSLSIGIGEALGIVGSNGSGKSTLLRAIAGLQAKTTGMVRVRGEVRLLGVGATLRPKLSGYRNVMLGGLAIGMSRDEVESRLDEVADFSGLGDALARPLDTYSSGMRARLAFSIATLTVPDVLLIDEALAVGDRNFRKRGLDRLNEICDQAGTVIMVTHNLNEIRRTCDRAIWFDAGQIVADGAVEDVLEVYESR